MKMIKIKLKFFSLKVFNYLIEIICVKKRSKKNADTNFNGMNFNTQVNESN